MQTLGADAIANHPPIERLMPHGFRGDGFSLFAHAATLEQSVHTFIGGLMPRRLSNKLVLSVGSSYSKFYVDWGPEEAWEDLIFPARQPEAFLRELSGSCLTCMPLSEIGDLSAMYLKRLSFGDRILTADPAKNLKGLQDTESSFPQANIADRPQVSRTLEAPEVVEYRRWAVE